MHNDIWINSKNHSQHHHHHHHYIIFTLHVTFLSRVPPEPLHLASQPVDHQEGDLEPHAESGSVQNSELLAPQLLHPCQDNYGQGGIMPRSDAGI